MGIPLALNLASRLAGAAGRHQVFVTAATREHAGDVTAAEFLPIGSRVLKGVLTPEELFEVRCAGAVPSDRLRDLVCGMELGPNEIAVRLELGGAERVFCSETCLRHFVADPARYLAGS